jgi:hypothetical protein
MVFHWRWLSCVVGWRLLKDALKPAWMLGFQFFTLNLFPGLFPGLVLATPIFEHAA